MKDKTLRALLVTATVLLVVDHVVMWMSELWGIAAGMIGAGIAVVVGIVCGRMAKAGVSNVGWFLVPTLLFTALPAAAKIWWFFTVKKTLLDRLWELAPLMLGFVAPLGLILTVYVEMSRRSSNTAP